MVTTDLKVWLHRRQRPRRYAFLKDLLATQALTRGQLLRRQRADLAAMIRFAHDNTAWYRKTLADSGRDGDMDIHRLPVLRRADVSAHLPELLAHGHDPRSTPIGYTGGSTGNPLAFYYNEEKHELMRAGMMRSYMLSGWRPGQNILNFWGARQDTVAGGVFGGSAFGDWIAAETTLPARTLDARKLHDWASFIQRYRPVLLQGYASILAALARFVLDEKLSMPASLIGVYSTAELLAADQRETMERAFGCKVFNQYGSREIPNIACECRHGGMHVFTDMVWLESTGQENGDRLLVTSLTNRLMPFIRYENGDTGRLKEGDCACGSPFPLMEMGMCRQNDLILTPGGKRIHPSYFNRLLAGLPEIGQFQVIQNEPGQLIINIVAPEAHPRTLRERLQADIRADLDAGMSLELNCVPEIARTASGKHRFVISRL